MIKIKLNCERGHKILGGPSIRLYCLNVKYSYIAITITIMIIIIIIIIITMIHGENIQ